ncbi:MAG: creatininase family protein [Bradyrhizobium sp.]|nr:MAG: creatininase family protein [Bradyrhizobium sp.]
MLPTKYWADMSWRDFAAADMRAAVAVLPVGAIEQHGPHLPVGVDAYINEGYLQRAIARIPADWPVLVLPPQTIGASDEHGDYPGTLTLPIETLTRVLTEVGAGVARAGCRKLVFINAHGGNNPAIDAAGLALRARFSMLAIHASWRRLGYPAGAFSERERAFGVHGGDAETSLMLAFRPEAVKMDKARNFVSADEAMARQFKRLRASPPHGFAWMASDLNSEGAVGDAANATAARGEACAEHGVAAFIELLADALAFDLGLLAKGPLG